MSTSPINLKDVFEAAGSASALARALQITPAAVLQWKIVPSTRVLQVEAATGISRHLLRPDVFGPLQAEAAE